MSKEVGWLLELHVEQGQQHTLLKLIGDLSEWARQKEPGTLRYEWWISADGTTTHVHEHYADSEAALLHLSNYRERFAERLMASISALRLSMYGQPSDELKQVLADALPVRFDRVCGFNRQNVLAEA